MRGVAEHVRQVEHVEIVDHRAEHADRNARKGDGADLRLLDRFLLAAELHRRIHLHGDPAVGGLLELLAEIFDGDDGRIPGRVHVGCLEHQFLLRERAPPDVVIAVVKASAAHSEIRVFMRWFLLIAFVMRFRRLMRMRRP